MLTISEVFGPTIQGEGSRAGNISYFIRFGGCNFTCSGFGVEYVCPKTGEKKLGCDTYYSVDPNFKKNWETMNYYELIERINGLINSTEILHIKPDIIITGGEPLIMWKNDEFQKMLVYYISRGHKITIETNGSVNIEFTKNYQKEIIFSISTKLSNSGEPEHKRININNLNNIFENTKYSYFKFVLGKEEIDKRIEEILNILKDIPYYVDIYAMPLGSNKKELEGNTKIVAEKVIKHGWKYTDRLHIRIWDDEKGK